MLKIIGIASVAALSASASFAQSLPTGVYAEGEVELSYLFDTDDHLTAQSVELTLGYQPSAAGSLPIGFEFDASYMRLEGNGSEEIGPVLFGVLFYDTPYGRISVGAPHAALNDYLGAPNRRFDTLYGGELSVLTGSYTELIQAFEDVDAYGARFDGTANGIDFGISYHNLDNGGAETITAGASYARDNYVVSGGFETILDESETGYFGSVEFDFGLVDTQILVTKPIIGDGMYYHIEATYHPFENLEMAVGYGNYPDESFDYHYVQAEYSFMNGAYLGAGYTGGEIFDEPVYDLFAGWRFSYGS